MKNLHLLLFVLLFGCGGNLSDEQRKKFREGIEQQKIVRITDAEIMAAALDKGHVIMKSLEGKHTSEHTVDSLEKMYNVHIRFAVPGSSNALAIEQELIEAYVAGIAQGGTQENIQKIYSANQKDSYDSLLYSKPQITKLDDGTEQLDGIWNVYLNKKDVVLDITKTK